MNRKNTHGWADLDKAWKSVAELKEELYRTEQKLENAVNNTFGKPKNAVKQAASHKGIIVSSKRFKGNERRKVSSTTVGTSRKLQGKEWKPKKLVNNWVAQKNEEAVSLEDHPKKPPERTTKSNQHELRQKIIESAINSAILRISSDDTSVSSDANHYRTKFEFPKESAYLPASTVKDSATQTKINKTVEKNHALQTRPQIKFSDWEKKFLDHELSDFEHSDSGTNSVALRETKIYYLNDPVAVPKLDISPQDEPRPEPQALNKSTVIGGLHKLKEIVERQKERREQTLFNAKSDILVNGNNVFSDDDQKTSGDSEFSAKSTHTSVFHTENVHKTDEEARTKLKTLDIQIQIKPPPVRKIAAVPPPPEYRGFAAHGSKPTRATFVSDAETNTAKVDIISQVPGNSISARKTSPPKRLKKTILVKPKEIISPFSWRAGQKLILKQLGPSSFSSALKQKSLAEPDSRVDDNPSFSQIQSSPDHTLFDNKSPLHDNVEIKGPTKDKIQDNLPGMNVENKMPFSEEQLSPTKEILKNLLTRDDESNDEILSENDLSPQHKYLAKTTLSKKRKAIKQPEPEQRTSGPKIRHYDPEKVRDYIQKQKAQRRKRLQEERQKKIQAQQAKFERLQQLYSYQKEAAKTVIKAKIPQPLKPHIDDFKVVKRVEDQDEVLLITSKAESGKDNSIPLPKKKVLPRTENFLLPAIGITFKNTPSIENRPKSVLSSIDTSALNQSDDISLSGMSDFESNSSQSQGKSLSAENKVIGQSSVHDAKVNSSHPTQSVKVEVLKNLAMSIQNQIEEGTKQLEGFLRTKSWIQERNVPSPDDIPAASDEESLEEGPLNELEDSNKIPSRASDELENQKTFKDRLPGVGDVHELYTKLIEQRGEINNRKSPESVNSHDNEENGIYLSQYSPKSADSEDSLSEGPLDSDGEEMFSKPKGMDRLLSVFVSDKTLSTQGDGDIPNLKSDPFNFINTWKRKPLDFKTHIDEAEINSSDLQEQRKHSVLDSIITPVNLIVNDSKVIPVSENGSVIYSPDFTSDVSSLESKKSDQDKISEGSLSNLSLSSSSHSKHTGSLESVSARTLSQNSFSNKSSLSSLSKVSYKGSKQSNISVDTEAINTFKDAPSPVVSVVNDQESSNIAVSEEGDLQNHEDITNTTEHTEKELLSFNLSDGPLLSSDNGKQVHSPNSKIERKSSEQIKADEYSERPEKTNRQIPMDTLQHRTEIEKYSTGHSEVENNQSLSGSSGNLLSSSVSPPNILTSTLLKPNGTERSPSTLGLQLRSDLTYLDSLQDSLLHLTEINRVHGVAVAQQNSVTMAQVLQENEQSKENENVLLKTLHQKEESHQQMIQEMKDKQEEVLKAAVSETRARLLETQTEVARQLSEVRQKTELQTDQLLHPQVVTRMATEAATAAATSAVIAVLETQKSFLKKKHSSESSDRNVSSSKHGSSQYSSDFETSQKSGGSPEVSVLSEISKSVEELNGSAKNISEHSIPEDIPTFLSIADSRVGEFDKISHEEEISEIGNNINDGVSKEVELQHAAHKSYEESIAEQLSVSENELKSQKVNSKEENTLEKSFPVILPSAGHQKPILGKKQKRSGNVSSPSPASLSDNDSLSSIEMSSSNSPLTNSSQQSDGFHSLFSEDSFAHFTLDMVRRMTHEEELRARHQLALLQLQEKALVEKARAEMAWLELLKKKLREKGADDKLPAIRKRQQSLVLRLRQERAQLRCMQETYRSVSKKHQALLSEKKKLLTEPSSLAFQILGKKEKHFGSAHHSQDKMSDIASQVISVSRTSSSTPSIATEEDISVAMEEGSPSEIPEVLSSSSNISSPESVIATQCTVQSRTSHSSGGKQLKSSQSASSRHIKAEQNGSRLSHHSSHSLESILQGLKRLEASKRYLTKREQRLLQRRKDVENLLQWQKKLDSEEMAVKELEQRALEMVDSSKQKNRLYISPSTSSTQHGPDTPPKHIKDIGSSKSLPKSSASVSVPVSELQSGAVISSQEKSSDYGSVPEESNPPQNTSTGSVEEDLFVLERKTDHIREELSIAELKTSDTSVKEEVPYNQSRSSESIAEISTRRSGSVGSLAEEMSNIHSGSNITTEEMTYTHSESLGSIIEEASASQSKILSPSSQEKLSLSGGDAYSESFESASASDVQNTSSSPAQPKSSTSINGTKKGRGVVIRSPLIPRSHRRHDSSGSDDSYTISHSETASDQSDIEGRIHALAEELRRRKAEAEKLKKEQKKRYREQLKERELSLQKQLEAYDQYILQTRIELEQQLEAAVSPPLNLEHTPLAVKPQIKQPRVAESRRLRKQPTLSLDSSSPTDKKATESIGSTDARDVSSLSSHHEELKIQSHSSAQPLKFSLSTSKVSVEDSSNADDSQLSSTINTEHVSPNHSEMSEKLFSKDKMEDSSSATISTGSKTEFSEQDSLEKSKSKCDISEKKLVNEESGKTESVASIKKVPKPTNERIEENFSDEVVEELAAGESDKSSSSNKTLQYESAHSTEGESLSDSHSTVNEGSVEEEIEGLDSQNSKHESDCSTHSSPKKHFDETFVIETPDETREVKKLDDTFVVSKLDETFLVEKTDKDNKIKTINDEQATDLSVSNKDSLIAPLLCKDELPKSANKKLQSDENISTVFVDNIVLSLCEDAMDTMFEIASKLQDADETVPIIQAKILKETPKEIKTQADVRKINSLTFIHEKAAIQVSEMLTKTLLSDAINVILSNCKKKNSASIIPDQTLPNGKTLINILNLEDKNPGSFDLMIFTSQLGDANNFVWQEKMQPTSPSLEEYKVSPPYSASGMKILGAGKGDPEDDFLGEQEWFDDDFVFANNQIQQQLLLQQNSYGYRQIPNKPPPPYTPPSSSSAVSSASTSIGTAPLASSIFRTEVKQPPEPIHVVPHTKDKVNEVVQDVISALMASRQKGEHLSEVQPTSEFLGPEETDIVPQCQKSFKNFLFDLTKEVTLDLYSETAQIPAPWLRPRKLTQKPRLPVDSTLLTSSIQQEVCSLLKIASPQTQDLPGQKCGIWSAMKLGRKKRDFVDTILISELKDEEPDWVQYDKDELTVKFQLSDAIFDVLVQDTVNHILHLGTDVATPIR